MKSELEQKILAIPDFPKKGILFRDITPLLLDSKLSKYVIDELAERLSNQDIDAIAGVESRGFLFGMSLAQKLQVGFIPVRKKGKLPQKTVSAKYELEYGWAEIEMHADAVKKGQKIHIHDDLLATGGTAGAVAQLIGLQQAEVASFSFVIELSALMGRHNLSGFNQIIESLVIY